ncbi:MAG: DUF885 domain-containing protein [Planctomycetes bacterium]|nr:DUF885 domain-containing protein [Planctomycetota bacterium]
MQDAHIALFDRLVALEPEEATALGREDQAHALRDLSESGEAARRDFWRDALALGGVEPADSSAAERLEHRTLERHARLELALADDGLVQANPQWATYPYTMTRYLASRRGAGEKELLDPDGPYRARTAALPGFLADHRAALVAARDRGRVAHRAFLECLRDYEIPAARSFFARLDATAAAALDEHRQFIEKELLPRAPETTILGPEAYARRLELSHGIDRPLPDLVAEARAALAETQQAMLAVARALRGEAAVPDFAAVTRLMGELQQEKLAAGCDLRAHYRGIMRRAMTTLVERGEFLPFDVDQIGMNDYPEGMRELGPGTNWPAPLLDPDGRGQFVLHPDPAAHSKAWSAVLAIHEGCPGHFLQSRGFQRHHGHSRAPLRFIAVADDVAIPRLNFAAMMSIEGWAVHAESLAREAGVHQGEDLLFAHAADALRAVRVIAEIGFQSGAMTAAAIEDFIREHAGLPSAFWEIQRYQRGPTQAVAYFFGSRSFRALRDAVAARRGPAFDPARFHDEIFAAGPVLPRDLEAWMLESERISRDETRS